MDIVKLIKACRKGDRRAQQKLYDRYAARWFGLCRRYVGSREDAEDVMVTGFFRIFQNLGQFRDLGSFEGWMGRIMVNESLMYLRKSYNFGITVELSPSDMVEEPSVLGDLEGQDLKQAIDALPTGYRTIFNMYVIEGYKHREIAEQLGISINTSKSQLILAKKKLREMLNNSYPNVG